MEHVLKNKILEAEKDQLASQVKEINLKLDLKIFQYSNLEKKNQLSFEAPLLHPMKEDNIENVRISVCQIFQIRNEGRHAVNKTLPKS